MNPLIRCWLWPILLIGCELFWAAPAQAGPVTCTATMTTLAFGSVNPQSSLTTASATLNYTCTNNSNKDHYIAACFAIGKGPQDVSENNRRMLANAGQFLQFQIYQDAAHTTAWGSSFSNSPPTALYVQVLVPAKGTPSGSATLHGQVPAGQTAAVPGNYQETLGSNTLKVVDGGDQFPKDCGGGDTNGSSFGSFQVTARVSNSCTVTASNINLGTVAPTATNVAGNTSIAVTCPINTSYYVGLSPSNGDTAGAGTMSGALGGNTDKVPYQLYQNVGLSTIWGNTATSISVGNGVAGTGTGVVQSYNGYAKALKADFQPDTYTDTVVVNVNY